MNLLIVDDQTFEIEAIKNNLNYNDVAITQLFEATNGERAQWILQHHNIDILLCDIEMPTMSGIDLLTWVRDNDYALECIFLTAFPDFAYAREAIRLGCLDYVLKPITESRLTSILNQAINKVNARRAQHMEHYYSSLWFKHQPYLIETFWGNLLTGKIDSTPENIRKEMAELNFPGMDIMKIYPIMICIDGWERNKSVKDHLLISYALKNMIKELLGDKIDCGTMIEYDHNTFFLIIYEEFGMFNADQRLFCACENYVHACEQYLHFAPHCYLGQVIYPFQLKEIAHYLLEMHQSQIHTSQHVIAFDQWIKNPTIINLPDKAVISGLFSARQFNQIISVYTSWFEQNQKKHFINSQQRFMIKQDFWQLINAYIAQRKLNVHFLLENPGISERYKTADNSAFELLDFITYICNLCQQQETVARTPEFLINQAKTFIEEHLCEDIHRNDVAQAVHMNTDYFARLFKKYTGVLIADYILTRRMELAKNLLKTDMSVSDIALHIGFNSTSYFSTIFKKYYGISPADYKRKR